MYRVLKTLESHFPLNDPEKFKKTITELAEKHGEDPNEVLAYFFHRHYLAYLLHKQLHKDVDDNKLVFDGPSDFLESVEKMTDIFKDWFTTERVDELMENAHQIADQFKNSQIEDEQEN